MTNFRIGQLVMVSSDNDNDGYDNFRGHKLKIIAKATNTKEHPGYDDCMGGEPLFDLYDTVTGTDIGFSLYQYELEKF